MEIENYKWFLVDDGLIMYGYRTRREAQATNYRMWETCSVVDKKTLMEDFELDPSYEKNWALRW